MRSVSQCAVAMVGFSAASLAGCVQIPENRPGYMAPAAAVAPQTVAVAPAPDSGDVAMPLSDLIQVEAYLTQLGYDVGPIDGRIGARTRAAIGAFEQADGHSPTGYYNAQLLAALRAKIDRGATGSEPVQGTPAPRATTAQITSTTPSRASGGGGGGSGGGGGNGGSGW